jgi:hypothetical protein
MPYSFVYDLSKLPKTVFKRAVRIAYQTQIHRSISEQVKDVIEKFNVEKLTGLNLTDAVTVLTDYVDVEVLNALNREQFRNVNKKALFLPHCSRAHMDAECKAEFNPETPNYTCKGCTSNCLINKASTLARKHGYDVYVVPGGSCIEKIIRRGEYKAVVGVACGMELKMAKQTIERLKIPAQGLFLTRNGCANTMFNLEALEKMLSF